MGNVYGKNMNKEIVLSLKNYFIKTLLERISVNDNAYDIRQFFFRNGYQEIATKLELDNSPENINAIKRILHSFATEYKKWNEDTKGNLIQLTEYENEHESISVVIGPYFYKNKLIDSRLQ